jgi:hypothetical protein
MLLLPMVAMITCCLTLGATGGQLLACPSSFTFWPQHSAAGSPCERGDDHLFGATGGQLLAGSCSSSS